MTQQELADLVGVTKGAVIHWEKYGFSSADKLQKLAGTFGVSVSYLLDYDTDNTFTELITKVNEWAISHGLDKGNPKNTVDESHGRSRGNQRRISETV